MGRALKIIVFMSAMAAVTACFLALPAWAQTDASRALDDLDATAQNAGIVADQTAAQKPSVYKITGMIIAYGLLGLTVVFFIIVIYGGLLWMTAFGNEDKASRAAQVLTHGGIGLGFTLLAYVLTNYVILKVIEIATTK